MKRFVICVCLSGFALAAAEPSHLLQQLRAEYATEMNTQVITRGLIDNAPLLHELPVDDEDLDDGRLREVLRTIKAIQTSSQSQKVQALCESLATEYRQNSAKKTAQFQEDFKTAVQSALTTGLAGASAKDLDASFASLARLLRETEERDYVVGEVRTPCSTILKAAQMILLVEQNEMIVSSADRWELVVGEIFFPKLLSPGERLRQTTAMYQPKLAGIMPEADLKEKVDATARRLSPPQGKPFTREECETQVTKAINSARELKDLNGVLSQIDAMILWQRRWRAYSDEGPTVATFRKYCDTYNSLRAGLSCYLPLEGREDKASTDTRESFANLRKLLTQLALPRLLGTPPGLTLNENESMPDFLRRAHSTAIARADWKLLSRVLKIAGSLGFTEIATPDDEEAMLHFISGVNQDQAHLPREAVISYLTALRFGPRSMPEDHIQAHLQAIQRQSPVDYDAAKAEFDSSIKTVESVFHRLPHTNYATSLMVPDAPSKPADAQGQ